MRRELIYNIEAAYQAPVAHLYAPRLADAFLTRLLVPLQVYIDGSG